MSAWFQRRLIDISMPLENDVRSDPDLARPRIEYLGHQETVPRIQSFFPELRPEQLPDAAGWAVERVQLTTHNGTHLDAPWHFHPTMNHASGQPQRAWTIDEVPLEWCFAPGVKLDFRHFPDGYVASAADVEAELARIGHTLSEGDIVLVNTRAGSRYGHEDYVEAGCGMGREATLYLLERGVHVTGTDAWSWDAPFVYTRQKVEATGDASLIWEGHKAGRDHAYCHLEKLHNLEALPSRGFVVSCFPVKIRAASAGWTRAVALLDEPVEKEKVR
jgi:kynurenine formamidase